MKNLRSILDAFQKPELEDLASLLGRDLSPRLRKSQLVEQMDNYLRAEPRRWMSHLMERDVRMLRDLVYAGPDKVQYLDFADYPSLLEVTGLVECDDSDEHFHKVWISREVYDIVSPVIDKVIHSGEKSGQYELERVGLGYLNLYGIISTDCFVDALMDWYENSCDVLDYSRFTQILHRSPLVKICRFCDQYGDYLCSPCVENAEEIFQLREQLKQKDFPSFSVKQAREAGSGAPYFTVGMRTKEGMQLEQMYRRLGYEGFELVKAEYDTWLESQYTEGLNETLFTPLSESPRASELDENSWLSCCEIVAQYADSVPKWILCGKSAAETQLCLAEWEFWRARFQEARAETEHVEGEDYPHWTMPEPTISDGYAVELNSDFLPPGFAIPHVAPNDPCPCGSGLRYCRCHGKYLS